MSVGEFGRKGTKTNVEVNRLLNDAINMEGRYSENSFFAFSLLKWMEGERSTAYRMLEDKRSWSRLSGSALYWSKVMAFDVIDRNKAIADALQYMSIHSDKDNTELKRSVGIAYHDSHDYANSAKYLKDALLMGSNDYTAKYVYASSLYELRYYEKAIEVLNGMMTEERTDDSDMLMASCYLRMGTLDKAVAIYSYLIPKIDKASVMAQTAIYNSALAQNRIGSSSFGESVKLATEFLNRYPNSVRVSVMSDMLSKAFIDSKNYEESLNQISRIAQPTTDIIKAKQYILVKYSNTIQETDRYWNKKQLLLEALKLNDVSPYFKEALFSLASICLKQEQYQEAIKYATQAISLDNSLSWHQGLSYYIKGYALFNSMQYSEAFQMFDNFVKGSVSDSSYVEDAYIRMGDCMYQGKTNLDKAIGLYQKANEISSGSDKALLRMATIYATKGDFVKEIKVLDELLLRTNEDNVRPELMYKKAKAMVLSGDVSGSNAVFESIISQYPESQYSRLAMLENAMAYYNNGNKDKAVYNYKCLINKYPATIEASQAINDLRSIYMADGSIEDFISYTKSLGGKFDVDENEQSKLMFSQAENLYHNGDDKAKAHLYKYIDRYTDSPYTTKAKSYLADILYRSGEFDKALPLYKDIENDKSYNDIRQKALARLALIYSKKGDDKEASKRYLSLIYTLDNIDDKRKILLPALKSLYSSGEYKKIDSLINKIDKGIFDENTKSESYLLWAKSMNAMEQKKNALDILLKIKNKNIDTPTGAESYVLQEQLKFDLGDISSAKKGIENFIKESTPQQYWLAKAFILLSDIYSRQGDKATARQYLESLKHGYTDANKEIKDLIEKKLKGL